ncbi:MAG TPA: hypothetical protein VE130_08365 [Nitrososphaeraceae archaeon]|nr:hypothetical protein [Nitrososphaeraceae archaeon]
MKKIILKPAYHKNCYSINILRRGNRAVQPDVVPVGFDFDGEFRYVSGMNYLKSTKYKNVLKNRNAAVG